MVLGGTRCQVVSNTDAKLVLDKTVTVGDKEVIYPGEGGKQGCAVYGCLFLGKGAYGVVDLSEGTEVIVKPRGSSGTGRPAGPALQRGLEGRTRRGYPVRRVHGARGVRQQLFGRG